MGAWRTANAFSSGKTLNLKSHSRIDCFLVCFYRTLDSYPTPIFFCDLGGRIHVVLSQVLYRTFVDCKIRFPYYHFTTSKGSVSMAHTSFLSLLNGFRRFPINVLFFRDILMGDIWAPATPISRDFHERRGGSMDGKEHQSVPRRINPNSNRYFRNQFDMHDASCHWHRRETRTKDSKEIGVRLHESSVG